MALPLQSGFFGWYFANLLWICVFGIGLGLFPTGMAYHYADKRGSHHPEKWAVFVFLTSVLTAGVALPFAFFLTYHFAIRQVEESTRDEPVEE